MDIKESMEVLVAVEAVCDGVVKAAADGKLSLSDLRHAVAPAKAVVEAARGREKIPAELKDVDEAELTALIEKSEAVAVKAVAALDALAALAG